MNRLLTLATSGIFATGLAILPISGFAQQNGSDVRTAAPATQTGASDVKTPVHAAKSEAAMKQTSASKEVKSHHARTTGTRKAVVPAAVNMPAPNAPMGNAAMHNGTMDTSSTHSGVPAKTAEPGKS